MDNVAAAGKLTGKQQARRAQVQIATAITSGLGRKKIQRWWKVFKKNPYDAYVGFTYNKIPVKIHGFKGYKKVYALIYEEESKIVVDFYKDRKSAQKKQGLIKSAVLSERKDGTWTPLSSPRITLTTGAAPNQQAKVEARLIKEFLLADKKEGEYLDLEPRQVAQEHITFLLDTTEDGDRKIITAAQLSAYAGKSLPGRIVVTGDKKIVYFWPDKEAREKSHPPIVKQGRVMAEKIDGKWQIKYHLTSPEQRAARVTSLKYSNYLFATVGEKTHSIPWKIYQSRDGRVSSQRSIRGRVVTLPLHPSILQVTQELYSVTREVEETFKFVEFWASRETHLAQKDAVAAMFITFRANGEWTRFWAGLRTKRKFQALLKQGLISQEKLIAVLKHPSLAPYAHDIDWTKHLIYSDQMGTPGHMFEGAS